MIGSMVEPPRASPPLPGAAVATLAASVAAARRGDARAFAELHRALAPMVHAVLIARLPPRDVDDLVQEVFLSAWRALPGLREDEQVGAWLCAIARRAAARNLARARPAQEALPADLVDPRGGGQVGAAEILAQLQALPPAYRETLAMRLVEGLSGQEIAAATGLTPESVRVNLSRGMARLRARLSRLGWP